MASCSDDPDGVAAVVGVTFAQGLSSSGSVLLDIVGMKVGSLSVAARL